MIGRIRGPSVTKWFFLFFFFSGFCSLVDEVVWLRLAMAAFGVTTPFISIVLSVFMGGLALGSWGAGKLSRRLEPNGASASLRAYAFAELIIGLSAIAVPAELRWGQAFMERGGGDVAWASSSFYLASGTCIALALLPFATAMGATFPLAMSALRRFGPAGSNRSFSALYLANVLGAAAGTLLSALFLIELLGFRRTLLVAAALNAGLAIAAFALSLVSRADREAVTPRVEPAEAARARTAAARPSRAIPWLLFMTGLASMAMEVVWVRQYTPYIGNEVYSFATILTAYLLATFGGSAAYRRLARSRLLEESDPAWAHAWALTGLFAVLPLLLVDPEIGLPRGFAEGAVRVAIGLAPFCALVGFLTPMLVDRWSGGDPERAGRVYAVNIVGCILGPLVAGFGLLPRIGERWSLVVLALPIFLAWLAAVLHSSVPRARSGRPSAAARRLAPARWLGAIAAAVAVAIVAWTHDYEVRFKNRVTRRDYTATVIATGQGMRRLLFVNGINMTTLSTVTKMMLHIPMAMLAHPPKNTLVICFGMGTSFRSALSWDAPCTADELIPSVPGLFGYFHADAALVARSPGARIVIDDGRRFLARTPALYDVIAIDPPPPLEAAGSSLLYSKEFHALARSRLRSDGILSFWLPEGEPAIMCAIVRTAAESYPYLRVYRSVAGWGFHLIASNEPILVPSPADLSARMPPRAASDLVEWDRTRSPEDLFRTVIEVEVPVRSFLEHPPIMPSIEDDRPVNEYFFTRRLLAGTLSTGGQ